MGKSIGFYRIRNGLFKDNRVLSLALSTFIIFLILSSGPVAALTIAFTTDKLAYAKNEKVTFNIDVNINTGELIPITDVLLNITGSQNSLTNCSLHFSSSGFSNQNVTCDGQSLVVSLSPASTLGYGYGYGYGYAEWPGYGYHFGYGYGYGYAEPVAGGSTSFTYTVEWFVPNEWQTDIYTATIAIKADGIIFSKSTIFGVISAPSSQTYTSSAINIPANTITTIDAISNTGTSLDIVTSLTVSQGSVSIAYYDNTTIPTANLAVTPLNKYIEIVLDEKIKSALSWAIIRVNYTDAEVSAAGVSESSLRIHKWDGTKWVAYDGPLVGGVNTIAKYVWANVTSFSLFGVFGTPVITVTVPVPAPAPAPGVVYVAPRTLTITGPSSITIEAGSSATLTLEVTPNFLANNTILTVSGVPAGWITISPASADIPTGNTQAYTVTISVPSGETARTLTMAFTATSGEVSITKDVDLIITVPTPAPVCGNGICEAGEDYVNCPEDCPAPTPAPSPLAIITGAFIAAVSNPIVQAIATGIILLVVVIISIRKIAWRRKPWKTSFTPSYQERVMNNLKKQVKKAFE